MQKVTQQKATFVELSHTESTRAKQQGQNDALLVEHGDGVSGFHLVEAEGQGEPARQLFDPAERGGGAVEPVTQFRQHFVKQLVPEYTQANKH